MGATIAGETSPPAQRARTSSRRIWFDWHSWLGVTAGLLLFVICWSGAFAALSHEIDWLVNPDLRVAPGHTPADLPDIAAAVGDAHPDAEIVFVNTPLYRRFAADVIIDTVDGQTRHVYVDPYRLEIIGTAPSLNVQSYFRNFHRRLFLGRAGIYLVCAFSIPLLASLVTGLVFYKRWWRRFFEFRLGHSLRAAMSNLHKLLGLWTLWFVVIIAVTGGWYLAERTRLDTGDGKFVFVDAQDSAVQPLPVIAVGETDRLSFANLLEAARNARPDLDVRGVEPDRGGYFYVTGQAGDLLVRNRTNKIFVDPRDGSVAYVQRVADLSAYWRWSNMADPLHFGNFGGLWSKIVWFVAGLVLAGLCLSGTWVHVKRLQRDAPRRISRAHAVTAAVASIALLSATLPLPAFTLSDFGSIVDGSRVPARIPAGVTSFLVSWGAVTLACTAIWVRYLLRPGGAGRNDSSTS